MTRVLLITGARSLADDPAAEAWARAKIAAALVGVDIGVIGDAREGVDQWAWDEAATPERPVRVYRTRGPNAGRIWIAGEREFARWTTEAPPSPKATHWEWARWQKRRAWEKIDRGGIAGACASDESDLVSGSQQRTGRAADRKPRP